jgi:ribosomal protein S18 acetylase RimI-like enzyme
MMDPMEVIRLTPDEPQRLREIRLRALRDAPDAFGSTLAENEGRPRSIWVRQLTELPTFVAVVDGEDVGMVRGARDEADPDDVAWLLSMWVAPEARGRGIGSALVDALTGWARSERFRRVLLDVADDNHAAIGLYAGKGFVPTGRTGALPPPRQHVSEHERVLELLLA